MNEPDATVRDLLVQAEQAMSGRSLRVLKDDDARTGVLVFHRTAAGGMERVFDLNTPLQDVGSSILLAAEMGGG